MNNQLILIRGLPGSGKTTMAKVLALIGFEHYEADQHFEQSGSYHYDPAEIQLAHSECLRKACDAMDRKVNCVVSNTFTRLWEMQPYLLQAKIRGVTVRVIEAEGNWDSVHDVPYKAIRKMAERWEPWVEQHESNKLSTTEA